MTDQEAIDFAKIKAAELEKALNALGERCIECEVRVQMLDRMSAATIGNPGQRQIVYDVRPIFKRTEILG